MKKNFFAAPSLQFYHPAFLFQPLDSFGQALLEGRVTNLTQPFYGSGDTEHKDFFFQV